MTESFETAVDGAIQDALINKDNVTHKDLMVGGPLAPTAQKIFARPFRLVFKRVEDQAITWIEVTTLDGLKAVTDKVAQGRLVPVSSFATLDRQLWGHLAEHTGFLRVQASEFNAGIQPFGEEHSLLAEDMEELFGGFGPAVEALSDMRKQVVADIESRLPVEPVTDTTFVKQDGVNLTSEGEDKLIERVFDKFGSKDIDKQKREDNVEVLIDRTDPGVVGDAVVELDAEMKANSGQLGTITGPEADAIGNKVEQARCVDHAIEPAPEEEV